MTDKFAVISAEKLYQWLFNTRHNKQVLQIPEDLFFDAAKFPECKTSFLNHALATPVGVAAGPHTQLAQNIISAWLCGARYIELKTIQTLDELHISKPCIDMQDEGYNCEWSQELRVYQSYEEYLKAWVFIHLLAHKAGLKSPETIFNMSAGYDFKGICQENVQWFFSKMKNCRQEKDKIIGSLIKYDKSILKIDIPDTISDNITLSTMHGCPPGEIGKIGRYLLEEQRLHTYIKLNPTLLGEHQLKELLNKKMRYATQIPAEAFEHDISFDAAVEIINDLRITAAKEGLFFGIKLTNTLESLNHKKVFNESEKMMYMSGKALHPVSVGVAALLQRHFNGSLAISFSGGADFTNIHKILACGIYPVTVCSDLLKPGGYGRLYQYFDEIKSWLSTNNHKDYNDYLQNLTGQKRLENTLIYTKQVSTDEYYARDQFNEPNIKTSRELKAFDCIHAPCVNTCPANQDIPEYLYQTSVKDFSRALSVILKTNPLPAICGMVCDHECQTKCTRINYDEALLIRDIKRFNTERKSGVAITKNQTATLSAAIIGAGPSGLSCAFFLLLAGFRVSIFETKSFAGGMVSDAIPQFRISQNAINADIERIKNLGVAFHFNTPVSSEKFNEIRNEFDFVYIAVGAPLAKKLNIPGSQAHGVIDPLRFLSEIRKGNNLLTGHKIYIIGGGNTAMDVARAAKRVTGGKGNISLLYRRSITDMPADAEEIKAALDEGITIKEYLAPLEIISEQGKLTGIKCCTSMPGKKGADGRALPQLQTDKAFVLEADCIIPAIGQDISIGFLSEPLVQPHADSLQTQFDKVFFGGDVYRGASTVIKAIADGKKAAAEIIRSNAGINDQDVTEMNERFDYNSLMIKRSLRKFRQVEETTLPYQNDIEKLSTRTLTDQGAINEALRCMNCDLLCNTCITVCPNRANFSYEVRPQTILLQKAVLRSNKEIVFEDDDDFVVNQKYQVMNVADFCNECGNCTTFCPTSGRPFHDKPRFFINIMKFKEAPEGYFFNIKQGKSVLIHKKNQEQFNIFSFENERYSFQNEKVSAWFLPDDFTMVHVRFIDQRITEYQFQEAATMFVLYKALKDFDIFRDN